MGDPPTDSWLRKGGGVGGKGQGEGQKEEKKGHLHHGLLSLR